MRTFALLFVCLFAIAFADEEVDDPDVIVLTMDGFEDFLIAHPFALVEFYAPWCGHCKKLAPEYAVAATTLKESGSKVVLAKVDATVEAELARKFDVKSYPTLKWFREGADPVDFDGGRTSAGVIEWVTSKSKALSKKLKSDEAIATFIAENSPAVIAYLEKADLDAWKKIGASPAYEGITFGHVTKNSLFNGKRPGTVQIHRDGQVISDHGAHGALLSHMHNLKVSQRPKIYSKHWDSFVMDKAFPLIDSFSPAIEARASATKRDVLIVFQANEAATQAMEALAEEYKGSVIFTTSDGDSSEYGASGVVYPTAVILKRASRNVEDAIWNEEVESDMDEDSLRDFVELGSDGSYESFIKSEDEPEEDDDSKVKTLVGKTIGGALSAGSDIFIKFYAPWCGHCKSLAPVWEQLAESYADDEGVVIAKFDATANKVPAGFNVKGFPTLIFQTGKGKKSSFSGDRDLESFQAYIAERRTTEAPATEEAKVEVEEEDKEDL